MSRPTEPRFSLAELVESTGLSERTIRYYIQQGLVPGARGRGRSSFYTPEHLQRLARVVDLRDRGLSIDEIREAVIPDIGQAPRDVETWERVRLHPDLELHILANAPDGVKMLARQIEQHAARWLGTLDSTEPGDDTWTTDPWDEPGS